MPKGSFSEVGPLISSKVLYIWEKIAKRRIARHIQGSERKVEPVEYVDIHFSKRMKFISRNVLKYIFIL